MTMLEWLRRIFGRGKPTPSEPHEGEMLTPKGDVPLDTVGRQERARAGNRSEAELPPYLRKLHRGGRKGGGD